MSDGWSPIFGIFAIPVVVYFLDAREPPLNNVEPYAFVWAGCYLVRLALAMISTPGHRASRRRQSGALPAWSYSGRCPAMASAVVYA